LADAATLYGLGVAVILIGVLVVIVAIIFISISGVKGGGKVRGGGVVMIGPIPIIFGTDKKSLKTVMLLSLVIMVVAIAVMAVYYFLFR
jgi:uncharacterized protein (TIGR00304 family)